VLAGDAWRQTSKECSGVAGRKTSERSEDARRVAGRAATTGRVDGEIREELKRQSDCWYVPVCRVWGDSKEEAKKDAAVRRGVDSRWRRVRAREKVAAVRRGVILRQRFVRKVARMRKRVTSRCGMRYRKPYQRLHEDYDESQASLLTTRPSLRKVSRVATLFIVIIPSVSAVLGCV